SLRSVTDTKTGFYELDCNEGSWNLRKKTNLDGTPTTGSNVRVKGGYFPTAPYDQSVDIRDEMVTNLQGAGFEVERYHHEVGRGGQQEINYRFDTLLHAADDIQSFKYIIKNTAVSHGKAATFMPKPLAGDNGSGMHAHQSLWK